MKDLMAFVENQLYMSLQTKWTKEKDQLGDARLEMCAMSECPAETVCKFKLQTK